MVETLRRVFVPSSQGALFYHLNDTTDFRPVTEPIARRGLFCVFPYDVTKAEETGDSWAEGPSFTPALPLTEIYEIVPCWFLGVRIPGEDEGKDDGIKASLCFLFGRGHTRGCLIALDSQHLNRSKISRCSDKVLKTEHVSDPWCGGLQYEECSSGGTRSSDWDQGLRSGSLNRLRLRSVTFPSLGVTRSDFPIGRGKWPVTGGSWRHETPWKRQWA